MSLALEPELQNVFERLRADGARLFGGPDVCFRALEAAEREASKVLKVAVTGAEGVDTVFVKVCKPRDDGPAAREVARARVSRDFDVTTRVHASLAAVSGYSAVRPLACFPDHLAIVTAEARGQTLSALLERRATWWPSPATVRELGDILSSVGGWLRAFQAVEARDGRFALNDMREYMDVRLRRLLATDPPALDVKGRERVLGYFDRTAARVEVEDLREVLTHGDLAPSNVLIDGPEVTVIDFAMVTPGGVFMDVARLYTQLEFLTAKPKFRPAVVRELQRSLLHGFDPTLRPDRPLFRLFLLQHLLCHMSNIARNPAPPLARLYNRHQLRLRQRWLQTFAA